MIIVQLYGGLGNQMFQYAAGLALADRRRTVLKLDVSWFNEQNTTAIHESYGLGCFHITEQFATQAELDMNRGFQLNGSEIWLGRIARRVGLGRYAKLLPLGGNLHVSPAIGFYPEFFELPDRTVLDGLFQSERFFESVAQKIRCQFSFRYPPTAAVSDMARRIASSSSVAVHFRRGDYVQNKERREHIGLLEWSYYKRAIAKIRAIYQNAIFYIFSDDIEFIEREFHFLDAPVFVKVAEKWNCHDDLRLMSLCDHFIIANSTFSWWAAWLGTSPDKMVICPEPWFVNMPREKIIAPSGWVSLPREE